MTRPIRIGNGQGFWGDDVDAPLRLAASGEIDVLTLDYLAEVTMSVLAMQKRRDPTAGFARDFVDVVAGLRPLWRGPQPNLICIANAGGLNPPAAAAACREKLAGLTGFKLGLVSGDDLLPEIDRLIAAGEEFRNLETGRPISEVRGRLVAANAYLGAEPMVQALAQGARLVLTGRVADPSPILAAARHHHGRPADDWSFAAGATVAGHLIECGAQVTGGIWTHWLDLVDPFDLGYPIAAVAGDGSCVIGKPAGTGGTVNLETVKEQLVYEIGDPRNYLSPDCVVDFTTISLAKAGPDRVQVRGATGKPATNFYKVSAAYADGFAAGGTLTIFGPDAPEKARRCGEVIRRRLERIDCPPAELLIEVIGAGACAPGVVAGPNPTEVVLRISARDDRRATVERFAKELIPLVTTGPQGTTGYFAGRPTVRDVFTYWPCLVSKSRSPARVETTEI